jgi:Icc-related predicted phosphoesterase
VIITGDLTDYGGAGRAKKVTDAVLRHNRVLYAQPGNMDLNEVEGYLDDLAINLHSKGVLVEGVGFFGVGGSNYTPFNTPREYSEDQIRGFIEEGYEKIKNASMKIMVTHTPPYNTKVDIVRGGQHVGSTAVREFIEEYQPQVCLAGHIHEAVGKERVGETIIVNPGMLTRGGYVEVVLEEGRVRADIRSILTGPST